MYKYSKTVACFLLWLFLQSENNQIIGQNCLVKWKLNKQPNKLQFKKSIHTVLSLSEVQCAVNMTNYS